MVIKENENMTGNYSTGDLLEVTRKDGLKFKCVVVENYAGGFVGKVLSRDKGIGVASWSRYGLSEDGRFQILSECMSVNVVAKAETFKAKSSLKLTESVRSSKEVVYYITDLGRGQKSVFCICEDCGGWAIGSDNSEALKESFFNSQLSQVKIKHESA